MGAPIYQQLARRARDLTTPTEELEELALRYPGLAAAVLANPNLSLGSTIAVLTDLLDSPPKPALALAVARSDAMPLHCLADYEGAGLVWSLLLKVGNATRAGSIVVARDLPWAKRHLLIDPYERARERMGKVTDPVCAAIRAAKEADPTSAINLLRRPDATVPSPPWRDPRFYITGVILEYACENGSFEDLDLGVRMFRQLATAGVEPPVLWQALIETLG
jgi:hypothetical protein